MKVMKANYPSGIVLKQSGLFVNIRRRVCWEPRVPRLSALRLASLSFRLDSFALIRDESSLTCYPCIDS